MNTILQNIYIKIPTIDAYELPLLQSFMERIEESRHDTFLTIYREKRRDNQHILLLTLVGFFPIAGLQRIYVGQIGMGILYILTGGLCLIGTIIDLINYKELAKDYNVQMMNETLTIMQQIHA